MGARVYVLRGVDEKGGRMGRLSWDWSELGMESKQREGEREEGYKVEAKEPVRVDMQVQILGLAIYIDVEAVG